MGAGLVVREGADLNRIIRPLGEQIIIRTIPQNSVGSIVIPDTAKSITMMPDGKPMEAVHFVEAEVIATGPGKRLKGDPTLVEDMARALRFVHENYHTNDYDDIVAYVAEQNAAMIADLLRRAENRTERIAPLVKPGDSILYHPSVQKFDRDITHLLWTGEEKQGSKYFMIREGSVLAIIDRDISELKTGHLEGSEADRSAVAV